MSEWFLEGTSTKHAFQYGTPGHIGGVFRKACSVRFQHLGVYVVLLVQYPPGPKFNLGRDCIIAIAVPKKVKGYLLCKYYYVVEALSLIFTTTCFDTGKAGSFTNIFRKPRKTDLLIIQSPFSYGTILPQPCAKSPDDPLILYYGQGLGFRVQGQPWQQTAFPPAFRLEQGTQQAYNNWVYHCSKLDYPVCNDICLQPPNLPFSGVTYTNHDREPCKRSSFRLHLLGF